VVYRPDRHSLVECKPAAFVEAEDNPLKFATARDWCAVRGWSFQVVTERDVRQEPRLTNIRLLARYARLSVSPQLQSQVFARLAAAASLSLGQLAQQLNPADPSAALPSLLHLAARHTLDLDLDDAPLSPHTSVRLPPPFLPAGQAV
jgi:hypothetical protein